MKNHLESKLDRHEKVLPLNKLIPIAITLAFCCFLNMVDSISVTIASPYISKDLKAERTIQWAGTALLMSNAIFTVWTGRLCDIFGRKYVLVGSGVILAFCDLAAGFVKKDYQFFILRGLAGIGNGGLNSIPIITLSDVVALERRGLFQGILGSSISLGLALGPFIMSGFIVHTEKTWRSFYFFMCPSILLVCFLNFLILPTASSPFSKMEIVKNLDILGSFIAASSLILILIPINGGGSIYQWNSPIVISMFCVGFTLLVIFLLVEWKIARLPMIPLNLFQSLVLSNLLLQAFLYGIVWASVLYYMPFYLELIRELPLMTTCGYLAITNISTTLISTVTGHLIRYFDGYNYVIWCGFFLWTLVNGLMFTLQIESSMAKLGVYLLILGIAIGCTFQPTILAVQANSSKENRAIALSVRNVLRALGNSVGVAMSSLIYTSTLINGVDLHDSLPKHIKLEILNNAYARPNLSLFSENEKLILKVLLMKSMKNIFAMWIPLTGLCLLLSFFVKDQKFTISGELDKAVEIEVIIPESQEK
ncbi:uncharacterized protein PRCAT00003962001 [Priceomyces carsonii]|uniref:uncharacterized protein n=1 Tax=Priceomyces carsonii TaxID=28549 RepID=UPI002EDA89F8|nr:unnamed protein product [Priceomyces carsonii]